MAASLIGVSLPTFLIGILLIYLFSVELGWLPSFGRGDVVKVGEYWSTGLLTSGGIKALILPAITLGLYQMTLIMRLVDLQLSFPAALTALIMIAILGKGVDKIILALVIAQWAYYARTVRATALVERGTRLLSRAGLPVRPPADMTPERFLGFMQRDKKVADGQLRLILPGPIGSARVTADFDPEALQATLERFCDGA